MTHDTNDHAATLREVVTLLQLLTNTELNDLRLIYIHAEYQRRTVGLPGPEGDVGSHAVTGRESREKRL